MIAYRQAVVFPRELVGWYVMEGKVIGDPKRKSPVTWPQYQWDWEP